MSAGIEKNRVRPVRRQVEAFVDSWKHDHDLAMQCFDREEYVATGISVFDNLHRRYLRHMEEVNNGDLDYDPSEIQEFATLFSDWLEVGESLMRNVAECGRLFGPVHDTDRFRDCQEKAKKLLEDKNADWNLWQEVRRLTPPKEKLNALAAQSPPSKEWFEGDDDSP
jgi:hypothetical protein